MSDRDTKLPPEQEAIRAKCFHPTGTFVEFPIEDVETSIPARFEKIVHQHPERIAVKIGSQHITYGELNKAANRLAHAILDKLGGDLQPIALFIEKGISRVIANMAILKAGQIAIDANPFAPRERVRHIFEDARPSLILTELSRKSLAQDWANEKTAVLNIEDIRSNLSEGNLKLSISPNSFSEITYTSGSTGQSKGVVKTHRQRLIEIMNFTNLCHICPEDRIGNFGLSSLGKQLFYALLNGAAQYPIFLGSDELLHLGRWLTQEEITIFISLPTAFRHLLNTMAETESFPKLRVIRLGGEPLNKTDVDQFKKTCSSGCVLVNMYSSKETGTVSQFLVDKNTTIDGNRVPVGYPGVGLKTYVVDDWGHEVPNGQSGEIVVQSSFLSCGYWRGNAETPKSIHSIPVTGEGSLYFTGDIGRLSPDGCMVHLGRKDAMVKIRSFRVDVGEVEAMLAEYPGVKEVAITTREDSFGDTTLIAYLTARSDPIPTVGDLRKFLQEKLPEYMIPVTFVVLSKFPLLATGKINRRGLPDPKMERPVLGTEYAAPTTPIEEQLERIWAEVLQLDRIGIHDNFFDLGGHSLAAIRVVSRVIQKFKLEVPVKALFDSPSVGRMARVITQNQEKWATEEELKRMLSEVETISEEEARTLLAAERGAS